MNRIIHILPEQVASQIAAGEVVERPASAIKELVENALDAGARSIEVEIERGGAGLITVTDDGSGMGREDAIIALRRHATSKIRDAADLNAIRTLGFRGEALAAIASVSRMVLRTRRPEDSHGVEIVAPGGEIERVSECAIAPGTRIEVRELFFNTPARLKFLKTIATEQGAAAETIQRLAIVNYRVAFGLSADGRILAAIPRATSLMERLRQLFGAKIAAKMLPFDHRLGTSRAWGLAATSQESFATPRMVLTFVNGRAVRDRVIARAIMQAYTTLIPRGRHPAVALMLEMRPEELDVNVHPMKTEVRFRNSGAAFEMVYHALRARLADQTSPEYGDLSSAGADGGIVRIPDVGQTAGGGESQTAGGGESQTAGGGESQTAGGGESQTAGGGESQTAGGGDNQTAGGGESQTAGGGESQTAGGGESQTAGGGESQTAGGGESQTALNGSVTARSMERPERSLRLVADPPAHRLEQRALGLGYGRPSNTNGAGNSALAVHRNDVVSATALADTEPDRFARHGAPIPRYSELRVIGQLFAGYIVLEDSTAIADDGLILVDQHAAHERVTFERLKTELSSGGVRLQALLTPLTLELGIARAATVIAGLDQLRAIGFELEQFGPATLILKAVPAVFAGNGDGLKLLSDVIEGMGAASDGGNRGPGDGAFEDLLKRLACHGSVRVGRQLAPDEISALLRDLDMTAFKTNCPHGRPVHIRFPRGQLERMFRR
jgi:DNA mismatch repair protein MutL